MNEVHNFEVKILQTIVKVTGGLDLNCIKISQLVVLKVSVWICLNELSAYGGG